MLQGRSQEWNISRSELQELITLGLLTAEELEECVATEWQHSRISMHKGTDLTVEGVLNLGVCPKTLIEILKQKFLAAGGVIKENTGFKAGQIYDDGVVVEVLAAGKDVTMTPGDVNRPMALEKKDSKENNRNGSSNGSSSSVVREDVTGRLVLDCMGHFSPIVRQIRGGLGQEPDGMVLVLGGTIFFLYFFMAFHFALYYSQFGESFHRNNTIMVIIIKGVTIFLLSIIIVCRCICWDSQGKQHLC